MFVVWLLCVVSAVQCAAAAEKDICYVANKQKRIFFQDVVVNAILLSDLVCDSFVLHKTRTIHPSHHDTTKLTNNVNAVKYITKYQTNDCIAS